MRGRCRCGIWLLLAGISLLSCERAAAQDAWGAPPGEEFSIEAEGPGSRAMESAVRDEVRRILAQPDYRRMRVQKVEAREFELPQWQLPEWLKRFFRWLGKFFSPLGEFFSRLGDGLTIGAWVVLIAIVLVIIYLILRVVAAYQGRWAAKTPTKIGRPVEQGEAALNPGDTPADVFLARAADFASRGQYREAIGCLLLGGMSHAERAAWIRHRRGLTHRDYLKAMRGKQLPYNGFKSMLGIYEPICFGRRDAFREHYDQSLASYQQGFAMTPVKP